MKKGAIYNILIENYSSYEFVKHSKAIPSDKVWYTSSPWLLEKIKMDGETVRSIERDVTIPQMNRIGGFCQEASEKIRDYLDSFFQDWPYGIRVGYALFLSIRRTLFVLFYKLILLDRYIKELDKDGRKGIIVGKDGLSQVNGFSIDIERFDTLIAALTRVVRLPSNIEIINHESSGGDEKKQKIEALGKTYSERLLAIANLNFSLLLKKIWDVFLASRDIRIPLKTKTPTILLFKSCELLDESFSSFLSNGACLRKFKIRNLIFEASKEDIEKIDGSKLNEIFTSCNPIFQLESFKGHEMFNSLSRILSRRINKAATVGWKWVCGLDGLLTKDSKMPSVVKNSNLDGPIAFVTNSLSTPKERAYYFYLKNRKIPVFASEHSVTFGLSEMSRHFIHGQSSVLTSDNVIFYNESSRRIHHESSEYKKGFVAGAPLINRNMKFRYFQRMLTRKLLGLPFKERLIVFVANLYSNNHIYNPGLPTDYYYHNLKRTIIYDVFERIDDQCLLKLYPTFRYLEDDPFLDLLKLPENVKAIQFFEFRYLRSIGDVIICDSPQSTLGWAWSCRVPLIFLDLPSNPLLPSVAEAFDKAIFRVDCSKDGWPDDLRNLLLLPKNEMLEIWKMKEKTRRKVEEECIFGPPGNSGKRAAKYIIEETLNFYNKDNPITFSC